MRRNGGVVSSCKAVAQFRTREALTISTVAVAEFSIAWSTEAQSETRWPGSGYDQTSNCRR